MGIQEEFEKRYHQWREACERDLTLSLASDNACTRIPEFQEIVQLGRPALPYMIEKLRTDEAAHWLIYALEAITQKQFTKAEITAEAARTGTPLGNQGYARLWIAWWDKTHGNG